MNPKNKITLEDFRGALEAAVAERGEDYVYPSHTTPGVPDDYHASTGQCRYTLPDGSAACLIGAAFEKLEIPLPRHNLIEDADDLIRRDEYANYFADEDLEAIRRRASEAQRIQDEDGTWGEALAKFSNGL